MCSDVEILRTNFKIVGTLTNSRSYRQTLKLWELLQIRDLTDKL
ncbi:hypothetical protein LEP1GSC173_1055 [Leptospira interrogans str. HAI1594]|nr:hypothetical protein LEP1GSC173_1055 [Leptospira interrogans str. HAI1594]